MDGVGVRPVRYTVSSTREEAAVFAGCCMLSHGWRYSGWSVWSRRCKRKLFQCSYCNAGQLASRYSLTLMILGVGLVGTLLFVCRICY